MNIPLENAQNVYMCSRVCVFELENTWDWQVEAELLRLSQQVSKISQLHGLLAAKFPSAQPANLATYAEMQDIGDLWTVLYIVRGGESRDCASVCAVGTDWVSEHLLCETALETEKEEVN